MLGPSYFGRAAALKHAAQCSTAGLKKASQMQMVTVARGGVMLRASASKPAAPVEQVLLQVAVPYGTSPGEVVKLVGDSKEMGNWNVEQGMELSWSEGNIWVGQVALKPGQKYEFKSAVYNPKTRAMKWEDGGNRSITVPADAAAAAVSLECLWGRPSDMPEINFSDSKKESKNSVAAVTAEPKAPASAPKQSIAASIASAAASTMAKVANAPAAAAATAKSVVATPAKAGYVNARVTMRYTTALGEVVKLVGDSSDMGNWSAEQGCELTWTEGNLWVADIPLKAGQQYEFKMVIFNTGDRSQRWEAGNNRKLEVPAEAGLVALAVDCVWCSTTDMVPAALKSDGVAAAPENNGTAQKQSAATHSAAASASAPKATVAEAQTKQEGTVIRRIQAAAAAAKTAVKGSETPAAKPKAQPVATTAATPPAAAPKPAPQAPATPPPPAQASGSNPGAVAGFVLVGLAAAAAFLLVGPPSTTRPAISSTLNAHIQGMTSATADFHQAVSSSVAASTSSLSDTLAAHSDTVSKLVDTHVTNIGQGLSTATDSVADVMNQGIEGLSYASANVADAVNAGRDSISATTSSLASSLSNSASSTTSQASDKKSASSSSMQTR